ncbi:phosphomannomutase/phosphoglucomutase [Sedimenticola selenatireducens]|uniref:phosphomannomutase n=1 Tax=Sedimenticola selenatireducens TaxID=191960 RepID=A0A557SI74_9GAMM|nr:phosphomannomutase/phosphoglucomutase [Sedimenticola selenatireducens]TVO77050.1 phosphomannomutase/phosphoglucomutase [Sedimenticola selenatireducens]TVT64492.1 MAG: phosphomannomutase/phosphoglucomutase [Sedimenticola selenatireducens]
MLKRKKAVNEEEGAAPPTRVVAVAGSAGRYFNVAVMTTLILMMIAAAAIVFLQSQQDQRTSLKQLQLVSKSLATGIADSLAIKRDLLAGLATQREIRSQLLNEDVSGMRVQEQRLQRLLPDALKVRLFPKGWDQLDPASEPPISYASLDMLRTVERGSAPSVAEVHQIGTAQQHIALAVPVLADEGGPVVGVLHVAYPYSWLQSGVAAFSGVDGRIELQQLVKGAPVVLVAAGDSGASVAGSTAISGSIWQIAFAPNGANWTSEVQVFSLVVIGMTALLIMGVLLLQSKRFKQAMRDDLESMFSLVEVLKSGLIGRINQPRLEEFGHVFGLIRQIWQQSSRKPASEAVAVKSETSEAELTDLEAFEDESTSPAYSEPLEALPTSIFRAYDIRGVVGQTLNERIIFEIGRAIGSEAQDQGQHTVIVARDGRHSGAAFSRALSDGLMASGCDVLDIGMVPTPVLYFATYFLGSNSGVMITGSHNPSDYNGLKIVINGSALSGDGIAGLRERIERGNLRQGQGVLHEQDLLPDYIERIVDDVQLSRPLKLVVDCGNGVAGVVAPALFQALGCDVTPLYCKVDGDFPNHHPDPGKPENLADLITAVRERKADLGVAFDGDGDRLGVVDATGKIIWPDRLLMLLARDVLSRQPGADVIYDVKSSRHLADEILSYGGRPIMWKTGHSLIKAKMRETGALLAGEMSGHLFIKERWYGFDDGLYSCARLLELLSSEPMSVTEVFAGLPESVSTPELNITFAHEGENFALMEKLAEGVDFPDAKVVDIDGLRIEFEDGWGLVRPSNTTPSLVFRFEANSDASLERIQRQFHDWLLVTEPGLQLPF